MSDDDDKTEMKTLWSETLLEMLYVALRKNRSDKDILECLKDLNQKG